MKIATFNINGIKARIGAVTKWLLRSEPMDCSLHWSIYVRTSTKRKLVETHLPPIESAIGPLDFEWEILVEDQNPGLFRIVNFQNISAERPEDIVLTVLRRAYSLTNGWRIFGLNDLDSKQITHIAGTWVVEKPTHTPPALESLMFELQPGKIGGMTGDGGWYPAGSEDISS